MIQEEASQKCTKIKLITKISHHDSTPCQPNKLSHQLLTSLTSNYKHNHVLIIGNITILQTSTNALCILELGGDVP